MTKRCGKPTNKWLRSEAITARRARRGLERRYRRTRIEETRREFRTACRETNPLIRELRLAHYAKKLADTDGNARGRLIVVQERLQSEDLQITQDKNESQKTCDSLAAFFSDKLAQISVKKIRDLVSSGTLPSPTRLVYGQPNRLLRLLTISDREVILASRDTPIKSSPLDFVTIEILKGCSDVFGPLIAKLANLSFSESKFPDICKIGLIKLKFKKPSADPDDMANYRPITNLNTIGKILERLAQLRLHMERSVNEGSMQSAYRALHSTETAMTRVVNDQLIATDAKVPCVLLSLDIIAAFDALDHVQLQNRAKELFGFDDTVLCWLHSYLSVVYNSWVSLTCDYHDFGSSTRISTCAVVILYLHVARR